MKKKQSLALCLCFMICYTFVALNAEASSSIQVPVSSTGIVSLSTDLTLSTFGNTAIGTYTYQNDANAQSISYFKSTTTGAITDIVAYISGATSGKATAALYAVNGNSPSTLLSQSNSVNIGTTYSWVDFQLQTPYAATSGTTYGLAIMGNVPVKVAIIPGTGQRTGGPGYGSYANGFTNPFGIVWINDLAGAMSIYATGTTTTTPPPAPPPAPTPIPNPSGNNLAPMSPTGVVTYDDAGSPLDGVWQLTHGVAPNGPTLIHIDNLVTHNGHSSLRFDPYTPSTNNDARESDAYYLVNGNLQSSVAVNVGDRIHIEVWIRTTGSDDGMGARISFDYYASDGSGYINLNGNDPQLGQYFGWETQNTYVPWGTSTWTLRTIDVTVPTTIIDLNGVARHPSSLALLWIQARGNTNPGQAWFADAQLYINP